MIRLHDIRKSYLADKVSVNVLKGVDLEVNQGDFLCILGASGCGKSTLLNILGLLDEPTSGDYYLNNHNILKKTNKEKAYIRRKEIGFVFQDFNLITDLTVLENIAVPLGYDGINKKDRESRAMSLLSKMGMESLARKHPNHLSGGEQQRVAILRAIANHPKLLLADEPTGNLDNENTIVVLDLIKELNLKGMTIVMVTHDLEVAKYASQVIHIEAGIAVYDAFKV